MPNIFIKDILRNSVERASSGKATILYDDMGYPSYMYKIRKFEFEGNLYNAFGNDTCSHRAFRLDSTTEVSDTYIGLYESSWMGEGVNKRLVSLPGKKVAVDEFENLLTYCFKKNPWFDGSNRCEGWHMMTAHEYSAAVLDSYLCNDTTTGIRNYNILTKKSVLESDTTTSTSRKDLYNFENRSYPDWSHIYYSYDGTTDVAYTGYSAIDLQNTQLDSRLSLHNLSGNSLQWMDGIELLGNVLRFHTYNYYYTGRIDDTTQNEENDSTMYMWAEDYIESDPILRKVRYDTSEAEAGTALANTTGYFVQSKLTGFAYNDEDAWYRFDESSTDSLTAPRAIFNQLLFDKQKYDLINTIYVDGTTLDNPTSERIFLKYDETNIVRFLRGGDHYWNPNGGLFSFTTLYPSEQFFDTTRHIEDPFSDITSTREYDIGYHDQSCTTAVHRFGHSNYYITDAENGIPSRNMITSCRIVYTAPTLNTY